MRAQDVERLLSLKLNEEVVQQIIEWSRTVTSDLYVPYLRRVIHDAVSQDEEGSDHEYREKLIVQELRINLQKPLQITNLVKAINSDRELARQFDLADFTARYRLEDQQICMLSVAFLNSLIEISTTSDALFQILMTRFQSLVKIIGSHSAANEMSPRDIAYLVRQLLLEQPCASRLSGLQKFVVEYAIFQRYPNELPGEITAFFEAYNAPRLEDDLSKSLAQLFDETRGAATTTDTSIEQIFCRRSINNETEGIEAQIAELLMTVVSSDYPAGVWNGDKLGRCIHVSLPQLDWASILHALDCETFEISSPEEFGLLMAILKGALHAGATTHAQFFWGSWKNTRAQASLLRQVTQAPMTIFNISDFTGPTVLCADNFVAAAPSLKNLASQLETSAWNSLELLQTSLRLLSDDAAAPDTKHFLEAAGKMTPELIFLGCIQLPRPWSAQQEQLSEKGFEVFFGGQPNHQLVFYRLWQVDPEFLCTKFIEYYSKDPMCVARVLDIAEDLRILDQLLNLRPYAFAIELASLASRRESLNLEKWLDHHISTEQDNFIEACLRFLASKAEAENILQQSENNAKPVTIALRVETVSLFLKALMNTAMSPENGESLKQIQSSCLQVYPRLMNSTNANRESLDINNFAKDVEKEVEYYYGRLYEGEMSIANFVDMLHTLKRSLDARDQDVFACMLHSLFDEYRFFADYPLSALNITAILFGSLIQNQLLAYIPLGIALRYILDAVAHEPETNMFKFGVQALSHFQDRVPMWPQYCQQILAVPSLVEYESDLVTAIRNGEQMIAPQFSQYNGRDLHDAQPGTSEHIVSNKLVFRALALGASLKEASRYVDPAIEICDKVLFNLNNMSLTNLSEKLEQVRSVLEPQYFAWFANHLVSQRAAVEPNYHSLYIHFLEAMDNEELVHCILQETIENIALLLNSENTITSTVERTNLKNLGSWLGGLTLARNRPLRHKTISLKDLLLQGFDENRLIVVLPFVCRVLEQCVVSKVFKPPCPWTMAILSLLVELYESADMKLNLKFEIEVLCKKLNLVMHDVSASSILRNRPVLPSEVNHMIDDELQPREDMLRRSLSELELDQSTAFVTAAVADMPITIHPVISQNFAVPNLQRLLIAAAERAIREFILPVVERSVAVASISTSQLVSKDFALEEDVNKFRRAAHTMNQNLAGSLALVTCKEPLRGAFSTNLRILLAQSGFEGLSQEGETLLSQLISDNLDAACMIVEKAACERAITEIDEGLAAGYQARQKHLESRSGSRFSDLNAPRHAFPLPDPLRIKPSGLTLDQVSTYEDFARIPRTAQEAALYYSKEEARATIPEQDGALYGTDHIPINTFEQVLDSLAKVDAVARELDALSVEELPSESPLRTSLQHIPLYLSTLTGVLRDERTLTCSQRVCQLLFRTPYNELAAQCLTLLLNHFVELSSKTFRDVSLWLVHSEDSRKYNVPVIHSLMRAQIMVPSEFDVQLAKRIEEGMSPAIDFAISLIHETVFGAVPVALHSDFISSFEALDKIPSGEEHPGLDELFQQLQNQPDLGESPGDLFANESVVREQLALMFMEWVHLISHPATSERVQLAYILQLQKTGLTTNEELGSLFFRCMIEQGLESAARMQSIVLTNAATAHYLVIDAIAKLLVMMLKYRGDDRIQVSENNFERFLGITVLVMFHEHDVSGSNFHQKSFFRLFTSLLSEIDSNSDTLRELEHYMLTSICDTLIVLQPLNLPGFTFHWITLISHRLFMPRLLSEASQSGWPQYCEIIVSLLKYLTPSLRSGVLSTTIRIIYNSVLRILLVLLNDFPGLLDEFHHEFMSAIPEGCVQLRNLVLSSFPRKMLLPDPFLPGLKVDRLPETAHAPRIRADLEQILSNGKVLNHVHNYIYSMNPAMISKIVKSLIRKSEDSSDLSPDSILLNTLVLHCGTQAMRSVKGPPVFEVNSPWVSLLHELFRSLGPAGRYKMLGGIANQLRYPNSHTYFFSCVLLLLFSNGGDQEALVKEQITRVLLERLICNRPHPWGLLITFTELLKNSKYGFWELKFIRTSPEIETLFQSLFQHINQNIIDANSE